MRNTKYFLNLFLATTILFLQSIDIQGQSFITEKADSLFNAKNYKEATSAYKELLSKYSINKNNAYLKLAFLSEQNGNFAEAVYYLSELYELNPSDKVFNQINEISADNSFAGYERTDFNFFLTFYKEFYMSLSISLVAIAIGVFVFYFVRKDSKTRLKKRSTFFFMVYLVFVFLFINVKATYKLGIVKAPEAYMRDEPSAAGNVLGVITEGNRLNVIGKTDIWHQILWQRKVIYIKESDLWIVNE